MKDFTDGAVLTASGIVSAGPGKLTQVIVATDATNAVSLSFYDNASAASGDKVIPDLVITTSAIDRVQTLPVDGKRFYNGLYVAITCSGPCQVAALHKKD
jgi:hypothetical protein